MLYESPQGHERILLASRPTMACAGSPGDPPISSFYRAGTTSAGAALGSLALYRPLRQPDDDIAAGHIEDL